MRTEQEMFTLIQNTAKDDPRILAVYMNGSRVNSNAPRDIFQDYDIVYVVKATEPFYRDRTWIDRFGERLYMQYPDENDLFSHDVENCYGWLMQFADGIRLDLHVQTLSYSLEHIRKDRLCRILLDKHGWLPETIPTDQDYWVERPVQSEFSFACNEFWWCLNNVAKGLWREEIPYVQDMLNECLRPELVKVLSWKAGIYTDFTCGVGKSAKYLYRYIPERDWERFLETYASGKAEEIWKAVLGMCGLFDETAKYVAEKLHFVYNEEEADGSFGYLKHVRQLPKDAKQIF